MPNFLYFFMRLIVFSADTNTAYNTLLGAGAHMSVFGVDTGANTGDPNERDLLWTATVAIFAATSETS